MIGTEELEYLIKTTMFTSCVKNEKPVSLIISAKIESGKTELVTEFKENQGILYISDLTAWGIQKFYLKRLMAGDVRYIIVPDLLVPLSRKSDTVSALVGFFNALIEEGVSEIATYAMRFTSPTPIRCGLITTITKDDLFARKGRWTSIGFMSRLLPVSYDYSAPTAQDILHSICEHEYYKDSSVKLDFPTDKIQVHLPVELAKELTYLSAQLIDAEQLYGFRMQKHLQRLMMGHALMNNRTTCNDADFAMVKKLTKYINLRYSQV